jgi:hypothetical protein
LVTQQDEARFNVEVKSGGATVKLLRGTILNEAIARARLDVKRRRSKVLVVDQNTGAVQAFGPGEG